jgi:hypothetical protein
LSTRPDRRGIIIKEFNAVIFFIPAYQSLKRAYPNNTVVTFYHFRDIGIIKIAPSIAEYPDMTCLLVIDIKYADTCIVGPNDHVSIVAAQHSPRGVGPDRFTIDRVMFIAGYVAGPVDDEYASIICSHKQASVYCRPHFTMVELIVFLLSSLDIRYSFTICFVRKLTI